MKLNGSEILLECLLEQGADTIFGYPGGAVLNIYDALYKYRDKIRHVLTSHEQGAAHAADGYARSTGRVGVCLATSGPGATNLVTGIATAYMDSSPVVAITGNVSRPLLGKDSFQEVDIAGITQPITKHSFIVKDISDLASTVRRAFQIARGGRPGPVLIDITKDVTAAEAEYERSAPLPAEVVCPPEEAAVSRAVRLIEESERPLVLAGGGLIASGATEEFRKFIDRIDAPVALTIMGLGAFPSDDPRFTGMIGMHGTRASNLAAMECDLLIAMGTRFSDRVTGDAASFAEKAKILHIDIDRAEINKNVSANCAVVGDLGAVLPELNSRLSARGHAGWMSEISALKERYPLRSRPNALTPQYVVQKIGELSGGEAIIATDVGQHQMFACQHITYRRPRCLVTSGGLGAMGFGLGAAIGAAVGNPGKTVFNITGDGSFRMNCIELATAVGCGLPLVVVIMNNHVLGMVHQWQSFFYGRRYSHTVFGAGDEAVDFAALAGAYHAAAFNVTTADEVEPALRAAMALKKPAVVNVELEADDKVFPMIPAGTRIDNFWDEDQ
jgi:acetolactate synthase-1/2/3 large subunit